MSWFTEMRMKWIEERIEESGFVNRKHIIEKFKVSTQTATIDLQNFKKKNPNLIEYDKNKKRYVKKGWKGRDFRHYRKPEGK